MQIRGMRQQVSPCPDVQRHRGRMLKKEKKSFTDY